MDEHRELFVVVAYDIASDKRRNQVVNLLKNSGGYRVNFSVFELQIEKKSFSKTQK
jgi:CRISPR-associated endonuclease Cas2